MEIGTEDNYGKQKANKLSFSQQIQNDNTFPAIGNNIKISKTQYFPNSNLNINEENIDILPSTNQTTISHNQIEQTQNVIPETQILETQFLPTTINYNIQNENYTDELIPKPIQSGINNDSEQNIPINSDIPKIIDSSELAAESQVVSGNPLQSQKIEPTVIYNNNSLYGSYYNSQSNPIGQPQSEFIESQAIYGQRQSQFVESQEIYHPINAEPQSEFVESQAIYSNSNPNQFEDIMNAKIDFYAPTKIINQNIIQEPSRPEIIVDENDIRNVQNQISALKVSKTKYLSKEELSKIMESQENNDDDNNDDNNKEFEHVEPVQNTLPVNPIDQPENVYSTAYIDNNNNNIETNNDQPEENNVVKSNILGNDEMIKLSKTVYVKDENNVNYNEEIIEPALDKEIGNENNFKVLKIEDVENSCCPGLKCWGKLFG